MWPLTLILVLVGLLAVVAAYNLGKAHSANQIPLSILEQIEQIRLIDRRLFLATSLESVYEVAIRTLQEMFQPERVMIFMLSDDVLSLRAGAGEGIQSLLDQNYSVETDATLPVAQAARSGSIRMTPSVSEPSWLGINLPVYVDTRLWGVLSLHLVEGNQLSLQQQALLQSFADALGLAVKSAQLYVTEASKRQLAETLRDINSALVQELDLKLVLSTVVEGFCTVLNVEAASIFLLAEDHRQFELAVTTEPSLIALYDREYPLKHFTYTGTADLEQAITYIYQEVLNLSVASRILIPLQDNAGQLGFLVANRPEGHTDVVADNEIASTFAAQAAVAIRNAQLYEAQQAEAWVTTGLLQVAETVNAQRSTKDALHMVAYMTTLLTNSQSCVVLRWHAEDERYELLAIQTEDPRQKQTVGSSFSANGHSFFQLLSMSEQYIGAGVAHDQSMPPVMQQLMNVENVIGFPLWSLAEPIGLLVVVDPFSGGRPEARWLRLMTGIAHQTATLLESAALQESDAQRRRLEYELSVAHAIQVGFIPESFPSIPGWQVEATWRAARQVGGDFYDFIPLRDGRWGLVMADVTDKGVPAALFMAMSRSIIRAVAITRDSAKETLERFNELLLNDSHSNMFLTVFYAIWDTSTGQLDYSSAGHDPPLLYRVNQDDVQEVLAPGIAAGIIRGIELTSGRLTLNAGDTLLLYTDGITEAMRLDNQQWGKDALRQTLYSARNESAETILREVLTHVDKFTEGAPQNDDMTLLVLKRTEDAS